MNPFYLEGMAKAKILKKEWYPIIAPKIFGNVVLGETYVYEPEQMIGKGIVRNLMSLTNDVKRQNINVSFKVNSVENGKAFADVISYYMAQSSIKRLVRKGVHKIDMSFSCKTSDNKDLKVKPILITRGLTTGSVATKVRKNAHEFLIKYISAITYDNLINDLVNHKLQMALKSESNRIYPLRVCEIRSMEIVLEKKPEAAEIIGEEPKKKSKPVNKAEDVAEKKAEKAKEDKVAEPEAEVAA